MECTSTVDSESKITLVAYVRKKPHSGRAQTFTHPHTKKDFFATHQSDEDAEELDDVCVGDAVETAEQRVEHCNARAKNHTRPVVHVDDHTQGGA